MSTKKNFIDVVRDGGKAPAPASKRFTWSKPIITPQALASKHDFNTNAPAAPKPEAAGTLAPIDLPSARAAVAQARKEKKEVS